MKIRISLNILNHFIICIYSINWVHEIIVENIIFRVWSWMSIFQLILTKLSFLQLGYWLQKCFDIFIPFLILIQVQSDNFWYSYSIDLFFISFNDDLTGLWLLSWLRLIVEISFWVGNIWKVMLIVDSKLMFWHQLANRLDMGLQTFCGQLWNLNKRYLLFLWACYFF